MLSRHGEHFYENCTHAHVNESRCQQMGCPLWGDCTRGPSNVAPSLLNTSCAFATKKHRSDRKQKRSRKFSSLLHDHSNVTHDRFARLRIHWGMGIEKRCV